MVAPVADTAPETVQRRLEVVHGISRLVGAGAPDDHPLPLIQGFSPQFSSGWQIGL
jgi:hypothetical protein